MTLDVCNHNTHAASNTETTAPYNSTGPNKDLVEEALQQWIYEQLLQAFTKAGKSESKKEPDGTSGHTENALPGMNQAELDAYLMSLFAGGLFTAEPTQGDGGAGTPTTSNMRVISGRTDGDNTGTTPLRANNDPADNDPADNDPADNNPSATDRDTPTNGVNDDFEPLFNGESQSIYVMAAMVLLQTMQNKQGILNNRLSQISETNATVREISNANTQLLAAKSKISADDDKTGKVDKSIVQTLANTSIDPTGGNSSKKAEDDIDKFLDNLIGDDWKQKTEGTGTIELKKEQIDAIAEKLTSQSEALSTQNQTRNIKLQQQMSELQVTTQMNSAVIDQIKTLGSGIAQRI